MNASPHKSLAENKKEMKISSSDNFSSNINSYIICINKKIKLAIWNSTKNEEFSKVWDLEIDHQSDSGSLTPIQSNVHAHHSTNSTYGNFL